MSDSFRALMVRLEDGKQRAQVETVPTADLPRDDVLIDVAFSSLNYKDGLAVTGKGKVIRQYPMVPGIDLAGTVIESSSDQYRAGEPVIVTGWGLGEKHWGGYSQRARVPASWLVPMPERMTLQRAMAVGTAGFTAMLSVMALEDHGLAGNAEVLVTGAAGGVGSIAVAILASRGYRVVCVSGREELGGYLRDLGASEILPRSAILELKKPLASERWAGAVDSVGGEMLARILASMRRAGSVAACGLAGGADLPTTVHPFILRGVNLLGIDSVECPAARRRQAWQRIATELDGGVLDSMSTVISMQQLPEWSERILHGQVRGRVVVDVNAT